MSNCVSPVLSYGELHYGYEYQICKRIFLQEKDPFHVCMESGNHRSDSSCGGIFLVFLQKCRGAGGLDGADSRAGGACADGLRLVPLKFSETRGYHRVPGPSEDKKASIHIKRVIALPGETVQIKDGQILINGEVYNEKDEFPAITNAGLASEPITVGKGQYFVLGDNRNNSEDSRHNGMGLVNSDRIVGKLWFTISPWKKIGFV